MRFTNVARPCLERAAGPLRQRLKDALTRLREDPRGLPGVKALYGRFAGHLGFRVSDYRIVYRVDDGGRFIIVVAIAHRRVVYR